MLSLLGREARRSRGIHAIGRSVTNSALQYLQLPRKSRGLCTSGSGISYGHDSPDQDVIAVDGVRAHDGAVLATCGGREAQRGSHPSKWEDLVSVKMSETLAGELLSPPQQNELSLIYLLCATEAIASSCEHVAAGKDSNTSICLGSRQQNVQATKAATAINRTAVIRRRDNVNLHVLGG